MKLQTRVSRLEDGLGANAKSATIAAILARLDIETLTALAGPGWDDLDDAEVESVGAGRLKPPSGVEKYTPPTWSVQRLYDTATERERRVLGW